MNLVEKRQLDYIRKIESTPQVFAFDSQMERLRNTRAGWCERHEEEFGRYREWLYSRVELAEYRPLFAEAIEAVKHARTLSVDRLCLPQFEFILGSDPSKKVLAEVVSEQESVRANTCVTNVFVHVGLMNLIDRLSRVFAKSCIATADDPIGDGAAWPRPALPHYYQFGSWHYLIQEISRSEDGRDVLHHNNREFDQHFDLCHMSQGHFIAGVIQQAMINFVVGHEVGHASLGDVGRDWGLHDGAKIAQPSLKFTRELQADSFGMCVVWDGLGSHARAERYSIHMTAYGPVLFMAAMFGLTHHFLGHESGTNWLQRLCCLLRGIVLNLQREGFPDKTIEEMSADLPETAAVTVASLAGVSCAVWSELRAEYGNMFRTEIAKA